jgi:Lrp/AsnC family transcriptional regulator, regulator for asnA, asnC and gidA
LINRNVAQHFCAVTFRASGCVNLRILDILSRVASRPFVDIAKELKFPVATVHMRVKRLQAAGILRRFTITTDNILLGYDQLAFIRINTSKGSVDEVLIPLSQLDEILELGEMYGEFDLLVKISTRSLEDIRDIIANKIRRIPQIMDAQSITVLKTIKEEHMISLKRDIAQAADAVAT